MFKKKNESGRSMVEMLGVLAIIGVLSIGGIAGYTLSMRRHRANQMLDLMNKYALIAYGACQKALTDGTIIALSSCRLEDHVPYYSDSDIGPSTGFASINFRNITQESGVDIVNILVSFQEKEICKSAVSTAGVKNFGECFGGIKFPFKFN